jgi:hypothetical protein
MSPAARHSFVDNRTREASPEQWPEQYDSDNCLIMRGSKRVDFRVTSPTQQQQVEDEELQDLSPPNRETARYLTKICNGGGRHGCEEGCINCSFKFQCAKCRGDWDDCRCYDRSSIVSKQPPTATVTSDELVDRRLRALELNFQSRLSSVQDELSRERDLRKDLEVQLSGGGRDTSPTSKGSRRRRRSRERPRLDNEPREPIDDDAKPVEPDWKAIEAVLAAYSSDATKVDQDSTHLAEEVGQHQADEKWEERRKLRTKHRLLLFACQAFDPSLEVCEDNVQGTWSSAATRPVSGVEGDSSKILPPVCRNFLPQSLLQDIRMTAERAVRRDKVSDRRTPLDFKEFPKDEKVYSSSWLPADDKLFPQCHLSDESTTKLLKGVGRTDFKKPTEVDVTETQLQDFTARGRSSVQAVAMVQQLLRAAKVLGLQQKKATKPGSVSRKRLTLQCDMLDRVGDILHNVSRAALQTIHTQTLILRNSYIKAFKAPEIKKEEQVKLRDSTLFSSQVLPTQACHVALFNSRASLSLGQQDAISLSLKKLSQSFGTTGKGGPPVNPNKGGQNNTGGGGNNSRKRDRSASWRRNRSNSAKRPNNGDGPPQKGGGGYQQPANKGGYNKNPNQQPKGRGRGRGRGANQGV